MKDKEGRRSIRLLVIMLTGLVLIGVSLRYRSGVRRQRFLIGPSGSRSMGASTSGLSPPVSMPRAFLELAAACAAHGEAERAVSLLTALQREGPEQLGMDEWLDGAVTWYQCRRP